MDLRGVGPGIKLQMDNGATAQVVQEPSADGRNVRVRYVDSPFEPSQVGMETVVTVDEIYGIYEDDGLGRVR